jgi:hypothetical protein
LKEVCKSSEAVGKTNLVSPKILQIQESLNFNF